MPAKSRCPAASKARAVTRASVGVAARKVPQRRPDAMRHEKTLALSSAATKISFDLAFKLKGRTLHGVQRHGNKPNFRGLARSVVKALSERVRGRRHRGPNRRRTEIIDEAVRSCWEAGSNNIDVRLKGGGGESDRNLQARVLGDLQRLVGDGLEAALRPRVPNSDLFVCAEGDDLRVVVMHDDAQNGRQVARQPTDGLVCVRRPQQRLPLERAGGDGVEAARIKEGGEGGLHRFDQSMYRTPRGLTMVLHFVLSASRS